MSVPKKLKVSCPKLDRLRALMKNSDCVVDPIDAYCIPHTDAHMSEYLAPCDKRLEYMSNFTGSAGLAIVTAKDALLWTDGRYHTQANEELNKQHWLLMKSGLDGTPTEKEWLVSNLGPNSKVGYDPKLITFTTWLEWEKELRSHGHSLIAVMDNLIDVVGRGELPLFESKPVVYHPVEFSGSSSTTKISNVKQRMAEKGADVLILSALDEIAWLLNLRGKDVEYNPVFFAYAIISQDGVHLFTHQNGHIPASVKEDDDITYPIMIHAYSEFFDFIDAEILSYLERIRKIWVPTSSNYYIYSMIPDNKRICEACPIQLLKAVKNPIEVEGMLRAHIKCATAFCRLLSWLESEVPGGNITEMDVSQQLENFRADEANYMGPSFPTIACSGPNSAVTHYLPTSKSNRKLKRDEIFLCDSGCQFLDGTTDVTRTVHFGQPNIYQKETFTRVLKGQISLATSIFPEKLKGNYLDSFARRSLWEFGLDYQHGTSHGVGSYLHVHEGPQAVSWRDCPDDPGLVPHMMLSNEPGYYKADHFGIRLENVVEVVEASVPYSTPQHKRFLTFRTLTLVPIQTKLLDLSLLTEKEVNYLNEYHEEVHGCIGTILMDRGFFQAYEWLVRATRPISLS